MSSNPLHEDGRLPICKQCIIDTCYDDVEDQIDIDQLKSILMQCDRPFLQAILSGAEKIYKKTKQKNLDQKINRSFIITSYFRILNSFPKYKSMTWRDGVAMENEMNTQQVMAKRSEESPIYTNSIHPVTGVDQHPIYANGGLDRFEVTDEMLSLFGEGFTRSEYKAMWDKYQFLRQSYPNITNLHVEALVSYVRCKVKEESAIVRGDVGEADKWSKMAVSAADRAKINPNQLSKSDLSGGLNSFSELFQAVEQAVDVIPILPQFKFRPNDAVDFNIWCLINYLRDLEGKPLCEYQDVYRFYDERKAEYIKQYGDPYHIFQDDPTESNRESIMQFIDVPSDFTNNNQDGET